MMNVYASADHHTRELLLENIRERPGISFSRLMRVLNLNEGTLRYHLRYLERKDLISSKKDGTKRVYYSALPRSAGADRTDLTREQKRVLGIISRSPGIGQKGILGYTDLSRTGLKNIIRKLKNYHLIWEVENGNGLGYEVITRKRLKEEMLLDLAEKFLRDEIDQRTFLDLTEWLEEDPENN